MLQASKDAGARNHRSVSRSTQAGILIGAAAAAKSFERTLMPRKTRDQGIVTGLSVSLTYVTTAVFQDLIESFATFMMKRDGDSEDGALRRASMLADLGAVAAGVTMNRKLAQQPGESM